MDEGVVSRQDADDGAGPLTTLLLRHVSADATIRALDLLASAGIPPVPTANGGAVYVLVDMAGADPDAPVAAAVVTGPDSSGAAELRALAVGTGYGGRGLDRRLLTAVTDLLRTGGARRVLVCVGPRAGGDRLYEQAGFRPVPTNAGRDRPPPPDFDSWYELEL